MFCFFAYKCEEGYKVGTTSRQVCHHSGGFELKTIGYLSGVVWFLKWYSSNKERYQTTELGKDPKRFSSKSAVTGSHSLN